MRALICLAFIAIVVSPVTRAAGPPDSDSAQAKRERFMNGGFLPIATGPDAQSSSDSVGENQGTFADWSNSTNTFGMYTMTINDSGELLGEFCYYKTTTCQWMIGMHTECNQGLNGIVLANSESSATSLDIVCRGKIPGISLYAYVFKSWKLLESAIGSSLRIGFAIPLASDQFTVVRFSLSGRTEAQQAMESRFFAKVKNSTVDQVM